MPLNIALLFDEYKYTSSNQSNINVGDVGYRFRKEFDSGWFNGKVVKILPHAVGGQDRRCVYEDGDFEDLMFDELKRLATLLPHDFVGVIKWRLTWECMRVDMVATRIYLF
jgi:hypothetical protein